MAYACRVLADSISPAGHRITTFEVTFPRIVLAELNTHCMLDRNSASSRAIPVAKRVAAVKTDPFIPEAFGRNQKGMQPGEALSGKEDGQAREVWATAAADMIYHAERLAALEVHKQYANRLLEPFSWHTAVVTATDLDNFFHLRINPAAQGELRKAAELMYANRENSEPIAHSYGHWHTPYVEPGEAFDLEAKGIDVGAISTTRCARLSYLTQNDPREIADELARYTSLIENGHMSPLGHVARPMTPLEITITTTFDIAFDDGPVVRAYWPPDTTHPRVGDKVPEWMLSMQDPYPNAHIHTVSYVRGPLNYSGKLNGWISRRAHVPGEHDILGHRESAAR